MIGLSEQGRYAQTPLLWSVVAHTDGKLKHFLETSPAGVVACLGSLTLPAPPAKTILEVPIYVSAVDSGYWYSVQGVFPAGPTHDLAFSIYQDAGSLAGAKNRFAFWMDREDVRAVIREFGYCDEDFSDEMCDEVSNASIQEHYEGYDTDSIWENVQYIAGRHALTLKKGNAPEKHG